MDKNKMRVIDRLQGISRDLNIRISEDVNRRKSLILAKLLERAEQLRQSNPERKVTLQEVMSFSRIRGRKDPFLSKENARKKLKKTIADKMANMCRESKGGALKTSFTIPELLGYCEMLNINPETVLFTEFNPSMLLPVEYCTDSEIQLYLARAKECGKVDRPLRLPLMAAPVIGVSSDVYFTASDRITLDELVKNCKALEVGRSNLAKYNQKKAGARI